MLHKPSLYWLARAHVTNYPANIGRKTFPRPWRWLQRRQRCRRNQTPGRHWSRPPFSKWRPLSRGPGRRFRQCTAVEWTAAARDWSAVPACLIRISRQILKINDFSRRIGKQGNFRQQGKSPGGFRPNSASSKKERRKQDMGRRGREREKGKVILACIGEQQF